MAGKKKKGKRRHRRVTDIGKQLTEEPGSGIEPGQALDEAESIEEPEKPKKAVKTREPEKKTEKTAKKPSKRPGIVAKVKRFFKDVHAEAKKIVWPDPEQQKNSTAVVVVTILALAVFMGFFSKILYNISDQVFLPHEPGAVSSPSGEESELDFEEGPESGGGDLGGDIGGGAPDEAENLP